MAVDIVFGWPYNGAISYHGKPKDAENIIAGMAVKRHTDSEIIKATGAANEAAFLVLQDQSSVDVVFAKSIPFIVKNAIILTDQYMADNYVIGEPLQVSTGTAGLLAKKTVPTSPVFGVFDGWEVRDSLTMMRVII
jgi:hypothetical protein